MASFPFRLPGRSTSSSTTRYAPLSTTTSASASHTAAPQFHPFRPRSLSSSLRRCLAPSSSPCFYALFFLSVGAILLSGPLSYLPSGIPPLGQTLSTFAGGCQPEDFVELGRAVWVADPAFARRFGCDPSACHCLFVEGGSGVGGASSRRLVSSSPSSSSSSSTSLSSAIENANNTTRSIETRVSAEDEGRIRRGSSSERTRRTVGQEQGGGYIRHVFWSASIKRVHYFHQDKPLCLVPHRRYDDLVQTHGLDPSQTVHATRGPSVWYSNDLVNPYHMIHFRVLPIFAWMVRQGFEAGEHITFFEPKAKAQLPGGYGTYLMRRLGTMMWAEDFGPHSSILFDDLWIRPTGRWLYPVHSFFPEVNDLTKQLVTYGTHVDARWNQMAAFFRRQLISSHGPPSPRHRETQQLLAESSQQPYILLVDRASTRCLLDSNTSSFGEITRVLREEGGLGNIEAVRMEDISEEEQFQKVMHASVLIGVHGAALTNMVWQPPVQSTVIEIGFNPRKPDYSNLARVLGRAYRYLAADRVEEKVDPNPIAWKKVYIDSRKLLSVIKEVLAERMERQGWLCC